MTRVAEEAMFDRRSPRTNRGAREPGPDPRTLAHSFYVKAGHPVDGFDHVSGLIEEAEENADKRELMRRPPIGRARRRGEFSSLPDAGRAALPG